jgi:hypothetical protein
MSDQLQQPEVIDPDNVPETLCEGMFNISFAGPNAVITFTHIRPEPGPLFTGTVNPKLIVRSRIVTSVPNLVALRDLLNDMLRAVTVTPAAPAPAPATGGPTRHKFFISLLRIEARHQPRRQRCWMSRQLSAPSV